MYAAVRLSLLISKALIGLRSIRASRLDASVVQLCNRVIDKSTLIAVLGSKPATGIRGATRSMRGEALFRSKRLISRFFHFHSGGGKLDSIVLFVSLLVSILPANQPS